MTAVTAADVAEGVRAVLWNPDDERLVSEVAKVGRSAVFVVSNGFDAWAIEVKPLQRTRSPQSLLARGDSHS